MTKLRVNRLLEYRSYFKPIPKIYERLARAWGDQATMFWTHTELPKDVDKVQFFRDLLGSEKKIITNILRFFTQNDVEVEGVYVLLLGILKELTAQQTCLAFGNMEVSHVGAYDSLNELLGLSDNPEFYTEFLKYKSTAAKYEYINTYKFDNPHEIARTIAFISGFVEGFVIFSAFCILANLSRFGLMKSMGQIAVWSLRDETLHNYYMTHMFHIFIKQYKNEIDFDVLMKDLAESCGKLIDLEFNFIDECFDVELDAGQSQAMRGITKEEVKEFIKALAAKRMKALGIEHLFPEQYNPDYNKIPKWIYELLMGSEYVDFFHTRPTEYSKMGMSMTDIANNVQVYDDWSEI